MVCDIKGKVHMQVCNDTELHYAAIIALYVCTNALLHMQACNNMVSWYLVCSDVVMHTEVYNNNYAMTSLRFVKIILYTHMCISTYGVASLCVIILNMYMVLYTRRCVTIQYCTTQS